MYADDVKSRNYYEQKMKMSVRAKGTREGGWVSRGGNMFKITSISMKMSLRNLQLWYNETLPINIVHYKKSIQH